MSILLGVCCDVKHKLSELMADVDSTLQCESSVWCCCSWYNSTFSVSQITQCYDAIDDVTFLWQRQCKQSAVQSVAGSYL